MTQTQATGQDIRRHPDSSIDFDFYCTRTTALRGEAKRDATTLRAACAVILTMVGALAVFFFLVAVAPMRAPSAKPLPSSNPTR